jgi:hypothetical protein
MSGVSVNERVMPTEAELMEVLAESEADVAAGRVVPGEVVRRLFRDSLARLEAKEAAQSECSGKLLN